MAAYYNEIAPFSAQYLCNLIDAGLTASGVVDTCSIEDVTPNDLKKFSKDCLFAGFRGWHRPRRTIRGTVANGLQIARRSK